MSIYNRKCPSCGQIIYHKDKYSRNKSQKQGRLCRPCSAKERIKKYGYGEAFSKFMEKGACAGKLNPFYGKTHSAETIQKIKNRDKSFFQTAEYKAKQSKKSAGKGNGMHGRTVYEVWVEKYGKEEAGRRMVAFKAKQSKNSSGSNNPMYGKPTPQGSGNGWSGWYRGWYFRSLKELSYAVSLDKQGIAWKSADIKIKYTNWDGAERTYTPDFIVGDNLVEIKPTRLRGSKSVLLKEAAALGHCREHGLTYTIIDPTPLKLEEIACLVSSGIVKFTHRYETKFKQLFSSG